MAVREAGAAGDSLSDDHEGVGRLFDDVYAAIESGGGVASVLTTVDYLWARLAVHIRAEHLCLFPSILGAPRHLFTGDDDTPRFDEAESAVARLKADHDFFMRVLAEAVSTLREMKAFPDADSGGGRLASVRRTISAVQERLGHHNELEEGQVYRWAKRVLGAGELADLSARVRRELDNEPPRFRHAEE
jgi:hypothetical protein